MDECRKRIRIRTDVFVAVLGGIGDILLFSWARNQKALWVLWLALLLWLMSLILTAYLFRRTTINFRFVIVFIILVHLLIDLAWDRFIHQSEYHLTDYLGVLLAIIAIFLLTSTT